MKKQLTILVFLFFICTFAWSQDQWIKTTTPCDKDLILKTPGRWLKVMENDYNKPKITGQERQQIMNRLNTFHQWIYNLYPSLTAVDGVPAYFITDRKFASEIKMESGRMENYKDSLSMAFLWFFINIQQHFVVIAVAGYPMKL